MPPPNSGPTATLDIPEWTDAFPNKLLGSAKIGFAMAPTPTNISTKSDPLMLKNGTPASPDMALARRVLPVPGLGWRHNYFYRDWRRRGNQATFW
jgi:hypothetical protein